jgi:hypothetical protein
MLTHKQEVTVVCFAFDIYSLFLQKLNAYLAVTTFHLFNQSHLRSSVFLLACPLHQIPFSKFRS